MAYKLVHAKKELADITLVGYVNIQKPDVFDPDKPTFKFDTELRGEMAEKLAAATDKTLQEQAAALGCKPSPKRPYKRQDDGSVKFSFRIKQFKEGERPFKVWDMGMNPITDVPNLTAGTVMNVNFAFYVSEFRGTSFISLQPTHIQVKQAKVYEGGTAEPTFGKGEGYTAEEGEAPSFGGNSAPAQEQDEDF